jgi:hypothetical protein
MVTSGVDVAVDGGAVAGESFEDLLGGLVPDERLRVLVPGGRTRLDIRRERLDAAVGRTLELFRRESREPALD